MPPTPPPPPPPPPPLRKHACLNILKISSPKTENFPIKTSDIFRISAQNIDCGYSLEPPRRGDSNEYPQSMFLSRNKKNNVYPCKPQFYYIKVGFKGSKLYGYVYVMGRLRFLIVAFHVYLQDCSCSRFYSLQMPSTV